jgi:hypothetical protein
LSTTCSSFSLDLLALELANGLFHEFTVEIEADGANMPRLLDAEDITGPTNLQIAHSQA